MPYYPLTLPYTSIPPLLPDLLSLLSDPGCVGGPEYLPCPLLFTAGDLPYLCGVGDPDNALIFSNDLATEALNSLLAVQFAASLFILAIAMTAFTTDRKAGRRSRTRRSG